MNDEQTTLMIIRGTIASMPEDMQEKIKAAKNAIEATIRFHGGFEGPGGLALMVIGAEQAAK